MKNKVVVITGASAGIGAALATQVSKQGARVVLLARREKELNEVAQACGEHALPIVTDVTHRSAVEAACQQARSHFGQIDVWVNNAGKGITRKVSQLTDEDVDDMMLINVKSALYGIQSVLPHFQQRKQGHIINVSSMLGRVPFAAFRSAYCAAKHALNSLTANLRMELQTDFPDIHVSCVLPGLVATDFGKNALHGGVDSRSLPNAQSAEEVAQVIADVIVHPRADVYTRPGAKAMVTAYYAAEDMGKAEQMPPFVFPVPATRSLQPRPPVAVDEYH
jgi:NADP-dependent 3-hydroxy acid dehydrogenase YdfG